MKEVAEKNRVSLDKIRGIFEKELGLKFTNIIEDSNKSWYHTNDHITIFLYKENITTGILWWKEIFSNVRIQIYLKGWNHLIQTNVSSGDFDEDEFTYLMKAIKSGEAFKYLEAFNKCS